ncbi:MAG TPA: tetratricopeptide repeat protein [Terriglobales bacterium]|nr:tetratricopeptide repeat protein [Terriglobales bacterium]
MTKEKKTEAAPADSSLFTSPEKRPVVLCLLLVVATLALYNSVSHFPFVNFDDNHYVTENLHVRAGLTWNTITWAFGSLEEYNWHPLTWISHALDCQLFGLNPAGHHYTNVLLHAINAVLLFLLLQRATGFTWRSLMVAALFALHPINVESVAWISERKNVLSMLFFLLALGTYGWYVRKPGIGRYVTVAALFALGLMAKPQIITFPFVLLLCDYWPLGRMGPALSGKQMARRSFPWLVLEKLPLLLMSAASAMITMKAQSTGRAVYSLADVSLSIRLENAVVAYARYVGKAFWPSNLCVLYPHPLGSLTTLQVIGAFLFLGTVTIVVFLARSQRYLVVGWLWFLGTLVPMIGLVQVGDQALADRYAYLSFIGLFVMVCWSVTDWSLKGAAPIRWTVSVGAFVALLALAVVAHRQIGYWAGDVALWSRVVEVTVPNPLTQDNLGDALIRDNRIDEAIPHFQAALQMNPADVVAHIDVATYQQTQGQMQQAIQGYQMALRTPMDRRLRTKALSNLASAYCKLGDYKRGQESYEAALQADPENLSALLGLGLLGRKTGNAQQAVVAFSRLVALQPADVGFVLLAGALEQNGRPEEAQAAKERAKQLSQNIDQANEAASHLLAQ